MLLGVCKPVLPGVGAVSLKGCIAGRQGQSLVVDAKDILKKPAGPLAISRLAAKICCAARLTGSTCSDTYSLVYVFRLCRNLLFKLWPVHMRPSAG